MLITDTKHTVLQFRSYFSLFKHSRVLVY